MARTSSPRKTTTPAKKTTAKKTTTRTPRKTAARKSTSPALSLVKPGQPAKPVEDRGTVVDLRRPLTVRRKLFVGPWGPAEQAAIRAALDSARLGLPVPVASWNGSSANLADGTILIHNPGPDRYFTAQIACRHGVIHGWPITSHADLREARTVTRACDRRHSFTTRDADDDGTEHDYDWSHAITFGVGPVPEPKPSVVLQLKEGIRRATGSADKTQPLPLDDIAEGLADRAATADTQPIPGDQIAAHIAATAETPKEHPEP